jgi:uncharacterized protein YdhG (YjbR/CyaY superfamily)
MVRKYSTVDEYIASQSNDVKEKLIQLRQLIKKTAPNAEELISYQMPAYKFRGLLIFFAACKNHIGFYPTSSGITAFKKELAAYQTSKGAIQFPLDEPLPVKLIAQIVAYRVKENGQKKLVKEAAKKNASPKKL